jgi:molecular chaperone DnaK (HSP70)
VFHTNPTNTVFEAKRLIGRKMEEPELLRDIKGPFGKLAGGKMMLRETEVGKRDLGRKQLRFCN